MASSRSCKAASQFIWASVRDGFQHLYLYANDGTLIRQLTSGEFMVLGVPPDSAIRAVDERARRVYFTANLPSPVERQLFWVSLDKPGKPARVTQGAGWHGVSMSKDARVFIDGFSNAQTPRSVTLRDTRGATLAVMLANELDAAHPYAPYAAEHAPPEFGTIAAADGQQLQYMLLKPRNLVAGKRYPVLVDVYGGPGVQRVTNAWGNLFHQYLAQHGYIVFALDNRGSGLRGTKFETALVGLRMGGVEVQDQLRGVEVSAQPAVRRCAAHRHLRLELRRVHDAHVPDAGAGRVRRRRRGRAGDRLGAVRHALHRALSIYSAGERRGLRGQQRAHVRGAAAPTAAAGARHGG